MVANTATYDAFGGVDTLDDGSTLLAVYRQGTTHVAVDGNLRKRTSTDHGATWSAATTVLDDATLDLRDAFVHRLRHGADADRVVVSYFTWDGTENDGARVPKVIYSDDDGATWSSPVTVTNSFSYWAIVSSLTQLPSGRLLAGLYGLDDGDSNSYRTARVSYSDDGGETWAHLAEIADGPSVSKNWGEPQLLVLANGDVIAMLRCDSAVASVGSEIHASTSTDDGSTWSTPKGKIGGSGRPTVIQRDDGLLLCMYRAPSSDDCRFRVSNDDGFQWSYTAADFTGGSTLDFQYGQWVELASGQIGAVYSLETSSTDADLSFSKVTAGS